MRFRILLFAVLSLQALAAAADSPPASPKPCRFKTCEPSVTLSQLPVFGFKMMGLTIDANWVREHGAALVASYADECERHNDCLMTPGNDFTFCDEILATKVLEACDTKFPKEKNAGDWDQCRMFASTWALAVDIRVPDTWRAAQTCGKALPVRADRKLTVTMTPAYLPNDREVEVLIEARDADTGVPIYGRVLIDGKSIGSRADPSGKAGTFYKFTYRLAPSRKQDENGRYVVTLPEITVSSPHYPVAKVAYDADPPATAIVRFAKAPRRFKNGKNRVTIEAFDSRSGKPLAGGVVMAEGLIIGSLGHPLTIDVRKKGKKLCIGELVVRSSDYADTPIPPPSSLRRCE